MLAEIIISLMVSLDIILFVREYRASKAYKSLNASTLNHFMNNGPLNRGGDSRGRSAGPALTLFGRRNSFSESPRSSPAAPNGALTRGHFLHSTKH